MCRRLPGVIRTYPLVPSTTLVRSTAAAPSPSRGASPIDGTALAVLGNTTCVNGRGWERDDPKIGVRRARLVRGHAGLGRGYDSSRSRRRGQSVNRHHKGRQCLSGEWEETRFESHYLRPNPIAVLR